MTANCRLLSPGCNPEWQLLLTEVDMTESCMLVCTISCIIVCRWMWAGDLELLLPAPHASNFPAISSLLEPSLDMHVCRWMWAACG